MIRGDALVTAFDLTRYRFIHLIGGGGKTTLMLAMARALAARGKRVIATTSTRIRRSEGEALAALLTGQDIRELADRARVALAEQNPIVLAHLAEAGKLVGLSVEELETLTHDRIADALFVEADGAAGRPLKAHEFWEPVIAPSADLVVIAVGAWSLGQPLDDQTVHRSELFARRVGCAPGTTLTPRHVVDILFHEDDYLARVPRTADVMVAVTSRTGDDGGLARVLEIADDQRRLTRVVRVGPQELMVARLRDSGGSHEG